MATLINPKTFDPARSPVALLEATLSSGNRAIATEFIAALKTSIESRVGATLVLGGDAGTGKSHLLAYIHAKLVSDLGDEAVFYARLAQGIRGLDSADELIRACVPEHSDAEAQAHFEEVRGGRPGVLFLDDIDGVMTGLAKGQWRVFETFVRNLGCVSLVITGRHAQTFRKIESFDKSCLRELRRLPLSEAQSFFGLSTGAYGADPEFGLRLSTVKGRGMAIALWHIVRGNLRWMDGAACFAQHAQAFDLLSWITQLVDKVATPYYEAILRKLSAQQYRILDGLAGHRGRAVTVKELASSLRLPSQTVSRQLFDLRKDYRVKSTTLGRESFYELSDPVLRFVFDARNGRADRIELSCAILEDWFKVEQLRAEARSLQLPIPEPEDGSEEVSAVDISAIEEMFQKGNALAKEGKHEESIAVWDEALERFKSSESLTIQLHLITVLLNKGAVLVDMRRIGYAIQTYDRIVDRCAAHPQSAFTELGARALRYKAESLLRRGEDVEALEVLDSLLAAQPQDVAATAQRVAILFELSKDGEAIDYLRSVLQSGDTISQTILANNLIGLLATDAEALRKILPAYASRSDCLVRGLFMWVQDLLPLEPGIATELEHAENTLRDVFRAYDHAIAILEFVSIARRAALGDARARFELPLEQRLFVAPVESA